jgi:Ca2+-transporting ATPase
MDPDEVLGLLDVDPITGLSEAEVTERAGRYGPNRVEETDVVRWWTVLARQFASPLIAILGVAVAISLVAGEATDAVVIAAIIVVNGALGFVQEWRAEGAIEALRALLAPTALVKRGGRLGEVPVDELVPGDLVELRTGMRVPADIRALDAARMLVDEAPLTGESLAVMKARHAVDPAAGLSDRISMLFAGTVVTEGHGRGVVVATGVETELGRIATMTQDVERVPTPLQRELAGLGRALGVVALAVTALVTVGGIVGGKDVDEMLLTGISLAVAVVPEGLPAVVTVTLALGLRAMARQHALARRLEAVETLGAATVVCTDKTGTLTSNEMTVRRIWTPDGVVSVTGVGYEPIGEIIPLDGAVSAELIETLDALATTAVICNHADVVRDGAEWRPVGEPTEAALVTMAERLGHQPPEIEIRDEIPFTSTRKRMDVLVEHDGHVHLHTKGAPDAVLAASTSLLTEGRVEEVTPERRHQIEGAVDEMASRGLRTLALARRTFDLPGPREPFEDLGDLTLIGVVGILDPPRPEVPDAVGRSLSAGITVVVITGDAGPTALAVAEEIGLPAETVTLGVEIDEMTDEELAARLDGSVVFARTAPAHKLRLVEVLQASGEVVAMTGDGVNDAPALRRAELGVAMGRRGTDAAKAASDLVLTDDDFATIVAAVAEGRRQYANIRRFVRYLLSSNLGEIIAISGNLLIGGPLILQPAQILWMNLLTDGANAVALGVEKAEGDVMDQPPRPTDSHILDRTSLAWICGIGSLIGLVTLAVFEVSRRNGADLVLAQTLAFTAIVLLEKMNVFNFRADRLSLRQVGIFSNRWLVVAWLSTLLAQILVVHWPPLQRAMHTTGLDAGHWLTLFAIALPVLFIGETVKAVSRHRAAGPSSLDPSGPVGKHLSS